MKRIKTFLLRFLEANPLLREIFCVYMRNVNRKYIAEVKRRRTASIFDYKLLAQNLPYHPIFFIEDANFYGLLYHLCSYANLDVKFLSLKRKHYLYIEHGIITGDYVDMHHIEKSSLLLTFSDFRINKIRTNSSIPAVAVGPYIQYVTPLLLPNEFMAIKKDLGKVLLVFPSHSIHSVHAHFNFEDLIDEIYRKSEGFDSVLVCLYWVDVLRGDGIHYQKAGYKVCCSGHRDDLNFLPRLKTIIELSDHVMTNSIGTHLGYSVSMGKPVYVYEQTVKVEQKNDTRVNKELFSGSNPVSNSYAKQNKEIKSFFNTWQNELTSDQINIVDTIYGTSIKLAKAELAGVLNSR